MNLTGRTVALSRFRVNDSPGFADSHSQPLMQLAGFTSLRSWPFLAFMTTTFALGSLLVTNNGAASSRVLSKYARKSLRNVEYATASMRPLSCTFFVRYRYFTKAINELQDRTLTCCFAKIRMSYIPRYERFRHQNTSTASKTAAQTRSILALNRRPLRKRRQ